MKIFFLSHIIFITLFSLAFGKPMFQDGDVQDSEVLHLPDSAIENHAELETELYQHHMGKLLSHRRKKQSKSWYNPTRLYHHYKQHCAAKKCRTSEKNVFELGKAAQNGGSIYLTRTASGKGRHYQSITYEQAGVLRDRQIPRRNHN